MRWPDLLVRPATLEDLSTIRYIHDNAFKRDASAYFNEAEIAAFSRHVYAPGYAEKLMADDIQVGLLGRDIVGTAAWSGAQDGRTAARIKHVFVRPLFNGLGIGHRLVETMEDQARRAGYETLAARATINAVGFFESRGYTITSFGTRAVSAGMMLAVAFMRKSALEPRLH